MSFCYFKKSHIGFFACFFSSWVNCCDLWGWTAVPSNPFCDGFLHIGCASPAASGSVNSCRHTSAKLPTNVDQLAHKCRPCCRHLSAIKTQRPHSIAGAGMRHGLYSGCPQQSLYALSRKGAKNAKATFNCRAGMRHGLYSGCPQQSLYALSRKGAKNAKATSNCRDLVGRIRAGPKGMFDRLSISVRRPPSRVLPDACLWGDASLSS